MEKLCEWFAVNGNFGSENDKLSLGQSDSGISPKALLHRTTHVTLTDGTIDCFDGHCDGQNGLHTHFARQRNEIRNGVARCEEALKHNPQNCIKTLQNIPRRRRSGF